MGLQGDILVQSLGWGMNLGISALGSYTETNLIRKLQPQHYGPF